MLQAANCSRRRHRSIHDRDEKGVCIDTRGDVLHTGNLAVNGNALLDWNPHFYHRQGNSAHYRAPASIAPNARAAYVAEEIVVKRIDTAHHGPWLELC